MERFDGEFTMRKFLLICMFASATFTHANASVVCNAHGAVVTTKDGTVLYLGTNCDAARKGGGSGIWFNAASFLAVMIDGKGHQVTEEIDCLPFCYSSL